MADEAQLALENLLKGDVGAAARSVLDPGSLGPAERETPFLDDFLGPERNSISRRIYGAVTNPWIIIGLIGTLAYPIGSAKKLLDVSKRVGLLERTFLPGLTKGLSFNNIFRGHRIREETHALVRSIDVFKRGHTDVFNEAIAGFERSAGRALTRKDRILLGMELDGLTQGSRNATLSAFGLDDAFGNVRVPKEIKRLADNMRKGLDDVWDQTMGSVEGKKALAELKAGLRRNGIDPDDGAGFVRRFFPHQIIRGPGGGFVDPRTAGQTMFAAKTATEARKLRLLPALDDMREVEEFLRPGAVQALERTLAATGASQYGLDATSVIPRYLNQLAKTNAFTIEGHGKIIAKSIKELKDLGAKGNGNASMAAKIMEQNILPNIRQVRTEAEALSASTWASTRAGLIRGLDGAIRAVGSKGSMGKFLSEVKRTVGEADPGRASNKLAGYFFLNSLGGNLRTAVQNLTQPALTTGPLLGFKTTIKGMGEAVDQFRKYFTMRAGGASASKSFAQAFPRFTRAGVAPDVLSAEIRQSLESTWLATRAPGAAKKVDQVKAALMGMFTTSERWNRISTFNAAVDFATKGGIKGLAQQNAFAARIVDMTQFTGGPLGTPIGLLNVNPLLRQFMTFPIRFAEFMAGTATVAGSAERAIKWGPFVGRNPGTLARTVLAGGIIQEAGRSLLGTDLEQFTFAGALPVPRGFGPLAALPFSPPAVSLAAAATVDIMNREFNQLRFAVPTLVPAGAALARGIGFLPLPFAPRVAETLGRRFTDYGDRDEMGRLPLYDGKGTLITRLTPFQLYSQAAGIPVGDVQRESEAVRIVLQNKDRIRAMRKQYADAVNGNDSSKAFAVREAYRRAIGQELELRPQELKAAALRSKVSRLERQLKTLPKAARPAVERSIMAFVAQQVSVFSEQGVDPLFLQAAPGADEAAGRAGKRRRPARAPKRPKTQRGNRPPLGSPLIDAEPESPF